MRATGTERAAIGAVRDFGGGQGPTRERLNKPRADEAELLAAAYDAHDAHAVALDRPTKGTEVFEPERADTGKSPASHIGARKTATGS